MYHAINERKNRHFECRNFSEDIICTNISWELHIQVIKHGRLLKTVSSNKGNAKMKNKRVYTYHGIVIPHLHKNTTIGKMPHY